MINSFYLLKPRMLKGDIYYKVFVTDDCIYFIKIGGQFHSRHAYKKQLPGILELLLLFWFRKIEKKQLNLETEIDVKIHTGDVHELLQIKNNFSITTKIIKEILLNKQGTFHTVFNDNGTILFTLQNAQKLKFIIPKETAFSSIEEVFHQYQHTKSIKEVF
ncbi:hypothetical protein [Bacillus cereus group sp. IBL03679]|uniref:hypothetical protein n=1 Tax=Bacillus cereus group sp. IBL03679 TaxID=3240095 RepID=UPI003D2F575C